MKEHKFMNILVCFSLFLISIECKDVNKRTNDFKPNLVHQDFLEYYPNENEENLRISTRGLIKNKKYRWTNGMIVYIETKFDKKEQHLIKSAINELNQYLCKKIRMWKKGDKDYAFITKEGTKCNSDVGRQGGNQKVMLGEGCINKITIQHELMHALGFDHEQSRPDRKKYVKILTKNIEPGYYHNFDIEDLHTHIPYDYKSIMHYGANHFTKSNKATIKTKNGAKIGLRKQLSYLDKVKLHALYCKSSKYHESRISG